MNYKRFTLTAVVIFIFANVMGFLIHAMLLGADRIFHKPFKLRAQPGYANRKSPVVSFTPGFSQVTTSRGGLETV